MIGATLGARYRVDATVGQGGMATVYRARDLHLERDVAVKVLSSELHGDPSSVARFVREAKLSAKVRHPNLVEVFDVALSDGRDVYLVMELLEGRSLAAVLKTESPSLARFFAIAKGITTGLRGLHDAKIVHRDLTANNVMLVRHGDAADHVKVLDLGIAKVEGQQTLTEPGTFIGTLEAMPPEQIRGDALTPAADVYALGVLFFRMLSGASPFRGEAATLLYQHLEVRPPSLRGLAREALPEALVDLVARCLEKHPSARYADASALLEALRDAEGTRRGEDTTAPAPVVAVPELALPATRAPPAPSLRPATDHGSVGSTARGEAVLEGDDDAPSVPLELEPVERKSAPLAIGAPDRCASCGSSLHPGAVVCSVCGARPPAAVTPFRSPALAPRAPLPAWLAPVGVLPVGVGKRVAAYSFLGAIVSAIFARSLVVPGTLLAIAIVSALGVYVRSRFDDER